MTCPSIILHDNNVLKRKKRGNHDVTVTFLFKILNSEHFDSCVKLEEVNTNIRSKRDQT